ncbi:MAG: hypothetical protein IJS05_04915 [Paludibacteraceae bacterium]|nr:hypothetical protein [Paludibacteraceae bacterium]
MCENGDADANGENGENGENGDADANGGNGENGVKETYRYCSEWVIGVVTPIVYPDLRFFVVGMRPCVVGE